jgi:hypothetical protein
MQDEEDGMEEDEALDLTRNSSSFVTSMKPDEAIVFVRIGEYILTP